jgi:hypothetical protein
MEQVKQLVEEGFDPLLTKRALAFRTDVDDARAILQIRGVSGRKTLDEKYAPCWVRIGSSQDDNRQRQR